MARFIALAEETSAFRTAGTTNLLYYKLLSESITLAREDYFPETMDHWTVTSKAEGHFSHSGDFEVLIEPVQWPKLLVLFCQDAFTAPAQQAATAAYKHTWGFGADELVTVNGVQIKPFTTRIGVDGVSGGGVDDDRRMTGQMIESITIEGAAREVLSCTVSTVGSGYETLETAITQAAVTTALETAYTQPYFVFSDVETATVGGHDLIAGDGTNTIESFSLTLKRSYDTEQYAQGTRYWHYPTLSGMAEVTGTIEMSWQDQDEYERFLGAVAATGTQDQASFEIVIRWEGATIATTYEYDLTITIPKAYWTGSSIPVSARDRIKQTLEYRGIYDPTANNACKIEVTNIATSYSSLA